MLSWHTPRGTYSHWMKEGASQGPSSSESTALGGGSADLDLALQGGTQRSSSEGLSQGVKSKKLIPGLCVWGGKS